MPDKWAQYAVAPTDSPSGDKWAQYAQNAPATSAAPADDRNWFQKAVDDASTVTPEEEKGHSWLYNKANELGASIVGGALQPIAHPIKAIQGIGDIAEAYVNPAKGAQMAQQIGNQVVQHPVQTVGNLLGGAIAGEAAQPVMEAVAPAVSDAGAAIRESALGDPNAAALRGLHVSPQSPKAVATLGNVQGARPFLQGVQGLEDLQARVPVAKQEIWQPYQDALDKIGNKQVKGPDGAMTTVNELEARRLELSAQLRTLRNGGPEAVALAQQKGLTQASLLREESQVKMALDPQLRQAGIDPVAIRKAFGQVSAVGAKVAGKTTVGEASQPSGFGRMTNIDLSNPRTWIGEPVQGIRDLAAGRPVWSTNPTDMNIREAFRVGGPQPNFGQVQPTPQPVGLLPAQTGGPIELPYYPQMSGDERLAALLHYIRTNKPPLALPARATAIPLPPPED